MTVRGSAVSNPEGLWGNWRWGNVPFYFPKGKENIWFWKLDVDALFRFQEGSPTQTEIAVTLCQHRSRKSSQTKLSN